MDLEHVEALLKLMVEYRVAELSYEGEAGAVTLRLQGEAAPVAAVAAPAAPAVAVAPPAAAPAPAAAPVGEIMRSPMVGTFYRAAKPGNPVYVEVGAKVRKGQVLCIVEAMKLMNEIECEFDGTLAEILVENGHPVQFNQPLFRIVSG
jgi:acetyl-CoA carboxylase biotin carboxyl carrier protein